MIKELSNYIEANTSFVVGTTLLAIRADSDAVDTCIVVAEPAPGLADGYLAGKRQYPLVIYSRGTTPFTARDNAYTVFDLLHGAHQITLGPIGAGNTYICNFVCRTPNYTGLDESGDRYVYSVPIDVTVTNMI